MNKMILRHNVAVWYDKIQKIGTIANASERRAILDLDVADGEHNEQVVFEVKRINLPPI